MARDTGRLTLEIMAVLEADLWTSGARSEVDILMAARASLASLGRADQVVIVGTPTMGPAFRTVEIDGPAVVGCFAIEV